MASHLCCENITYFINVVVVVVALYLRQKENIKAGKSYQSKKTHQVLWWGICLSYVNAVLYSSFCMMLSVLWWKL